MTNAKTQKPRVEILTIHFGINHGSVLQCFALCKALSSMGANAEVIDYVPSRYRMWNNVKIKFPTKPVAWRVAYFLASSLVRFPQKIIFRRYLKKYLDLTCRYVNQDELREGVPEANLYLVGSDQVWNSTYNGKEDRSYLLTFVKPGKLKASYAASIGKDELDFEDGAEIAFAVRDFAGVSVREECAKQQLLRFGVEARVDLDPVFFLDAGEWGRLASSRTSKKPYVLVYVIAQGWEPMVAQAREIADARGCDLLVLSVRPIIGRGIDRNLVFANPSDFLALFRDADFVISNSFHGTAFSIIFRKQFLTYATRYNARIENILAITGLGERLVRDRYSACLLNENIRYEAVVPILEKRVSESGTYLANLVEAARND